MLSARSAMIKLLSIFLLVSSNHIFGVKNTLKDYEEIFEKRYKDHFNPKNPHHIALMNDDNWNTNANENAQLDRLAKGIFLSEVKLARDFIKQSKKPLIFEFNTILTNKIHDQQDIENLEILANQTHNQRKNILKNNLYTAGFGNAIGLGCLNYGNKIDSNYLKLFGLGTILGTNCIFGIKSFFDMRKLNTSRVHKNLTQQLNNQVQNNPSIPLAMPQLRFTKLLYNDID